MKYTRMADSTNKPALRTRIKNRLSTKIEENKVILAYYGGCALGGATAIVVAKYQLGKIEKVLAVTLEELNAVYEIAGDVIDFVEDKGLRDEALAHIANLPVTEFTRQLL